jgi:hypothetical protein
MRVSLLLSSQWTASLVLFCALCSLFTPAGKQLSPQNPTLLTLDRFRQA